LAMLFSFAALETRESILDRDSLFDSRYRPLEAALTRGLGESAGDSWPLGETSGEVQVGTNGPLDEMDHE